MPTHEFSTSLQTSWVICEEDVNGYPGWELTLAALKHFQAALYTTKSLLSLHINSLPYNSLLQLNVNGDQDDGDGEDVPLLITSARPFDRASSAPRSSQRKSPDSALDASARRAHIMSSTLIDRPPRTDSSSSTCVSSRGRRSSVLFDQENVRLLRFQAGRMIKTFQGESDPCET